MAEQQNEKTEKAAPRTAPRTSSTTKSVEGDTSSQAPVMAGRFQPGEESPQVLTNRVPRGVGELPADTLADEPGARALQDAVNAKVLKETEQGYRGYNTDPTPNENYTLQGVGKGLPTPETVVVTPKAVEQ